MPGALLDTRFDKLCQLADSGTFCAWALCQARTGSPAALSSRAPTRCFVCVLACYHCLVSVAIVCNTPRCSAPLACLRQVPSSVPDLVGIVSSMTEENQAALTAVTASRSSSPLPEAALPTDESSTLIIFCIRMKSLGPTSSRPSCLLR